MSRPSYEIRVDQVILDDVAGADPARTVAHAITQELARRGILASGLGEGRRAMSRAPTESKTAEPMVEAVAASYRKAATP